MSESSSVWRVFSLLELAALGRTHPVQQLREEASHHLLGVRRLAHRQRSPRPISHPHVRRVLLGVPVEFDPLAVHLLHRGFKQVGELRVVVDFEQEVVHEPDQHVRAIAPFLPKRVHARDALALLEPHSLKVDDIGALQLVARRLLAVVRGSQQDAHLAAALVLHPCSLREHDDGHLACALGLIVRVGEVAHADVRVIPCRLC